MSALTPRTIEWIDHAPIKIEARAVSSASPQAVFQVLADHERWPEWFTAVKSVTVIGEATGVGASRRVAVPGLTVDEEFIVWEPGARWTFTGTAARPGTLRSLIEDCRLTARPDGGTDISYTMYLEPRRGMTPLLKLVAPQIRRNNTRALANLAQRAQTGA